MNANRHPLASLLVAAIASLTVHAQAQAHVQAPLTRAEVVAQYEEAVRMGDILAPGDSGMKLNELYPDRYPKAQPAAGLTRAQVVEELRSAVRSGDVLADGDSGMKENELHPQRYRQSAALAAARKTREQVRAETIEAIHTGDILAAGDSGLRRNELAPGLYAKAREAHRTVASASRETRDSNAVQ